VRHPATDAIEIEPDADLIFQQRSRGLVEREPAGRRLK
jgi:hypothetical protein